VFFSWHIALKLGHWPITGANVEYIIKVLIRDRPIFLFETDADI